MQTFFKYNIWHFDLRLVWEEREGLTCKVGSCIDSCPITSGRELVHCSCNLHVCMSCVCCVCSAPLPSLCGWSDFRVSTLTLTPCHQLSGGEVDLHLSTHRPIARQRIGSDRLTTRNVEIRSESAVRSPSGECRSSPCMACRRVARRSTERHRGGRERRVG